MKIHLPERTKLYNFRFCIYTFNEMTIIISFPCSFTKKKQKYIFFLPMICPTKAITMYVYKYIVLNNNKRARFKP